MTRILAICCLLCFAAVLVQADMVTYYEDHFDGGSLNAAWTAWGTGSSELVGSDLEFTTEAGDFHPAYESTYGVPRHVFLISPPAGASQWSAVTRVRYNTPDQAFEQVDLMAFADHNNNTRLAYDYSGGQRFHVVLAEQAGAATQTGSATTAHLDYFWMRLERNGDVYTGSVSDDPTANPDLVTWTVIGSITNNLLDPMVGVGGWNTFTSPSGEPAEFDYFRLQVVPEPSMLAAVSAMLLALRSARRRAL